MRSEPFYQRKKSEPSERESVADSFAGARSWFKLPSKSKPLILINYLFLNLIKLKNESFFEQNDKSVIFHQIPATKEPKVQRAPRKYQILFSRAQTIGRVDTVNQLDPWGTTRNIPWGVRRVIRTKKPWTKSGAGLKRRTIAQIIGETVRIEGMPVYFKSQIHASDRVNTIPTCGLRRPYSWDPLQAEMAKTS